MTTQSRPAELQARADLPIGVRPPTFAMFAEVLLVGAIVSVLSLGVITVLPALAAGIGHLRRHAALRSDQLGLLLTDFRASLRGVWAFATALPLVAALLAFNVLTASTASPTGLVVRWVSLAVAGIVAVLALRTAARKAGAPLTWRDAARLGRNDAVHDFRGSGLLLVAAALCVIVIWMLPILILIAPGMLALAVVGIEQRPGREL